MRRIKDLSPKLSGLKPAEQELMLPYTLPSMGERVGGLQMFSNAFKRGFGDSVFGSDDNGIWLGAAEYGDAPFRVDMDGAMVVQSATFKDENDITIIDAQGLVSTVTFENDFYYDDTNISTDSASMVDVSGSSLTFTLSRQSNVLVSFYALVNTWGDDDNVEYRTDVNMVIDGDSVSPLASAGFKDFTSARTYKKIDSLSCARLITLAAGEHTLKLQWSHSGAGASFSEMLTRNLNYIIMGK